MGRPRCHSGGWRLGSNPLDFITMSAPRPSSTRACNFNSSPIVFMASLAWPLTLHEAWAAHQCAGWIRWFVCEIERILSKKEFCLVSLTRKIDEIFVLSGVTKLSRTRLKEQFAYGVASFSWRPALPGWRGPCGGFRGILGICFSRSNSNVMKNSDSCTVRRQSFRHQHSHQPVIVQECRSAALDLEPNEDGRSGCKVNDEKWHESAQFWRTTVAFPISLGVPTSMVGRKRAHVAARVADTWLVWV